MNMIERSDIEGISLEIQDSILWESRDTACRKIQKEMNCSDFVAGEIYKEISEELILHAKRETEGVL